MTPDQVIEDSLLFIEANIQTDLSLEQIAEHYHFSKYYFHRLFSAMMGVSLNQYLLERRLNAMLPLIKDSEQPLTEVATNFSFSTPSAFTRAFKRQYGITPSDLRRDTSQLVEAPVPKVFQKEIKNLHGDIVSDFTIETVTPLQISGFVFRFDLAVDDFHEKIESRARRLLALLPGPVESPCYIVYSDCLPNSTVFNVIVGIPQMIESDDPLFFTVEIPELFVAQFRYSGRLIEMADVLNSDYARFLKIARQEADPSHINMIQRYEDVHDFHSSYELFVPIKKMPSEA